MRQIWLLIAVAVSLTILIIPQNIARGQESEINIIHSGRYGKGYRYNIQGWVYIHIEGEPHERGYQYGYLASAEIVDMINRWSNWGHKEKIMKLFLRKSYDEISEKWWDIVRKKAEDTFWNQFPDEYQEEIKGIAAGVQARGGTVHGRSVDYKDILSLNVVEECRRIIRNPLKRGRPFVQLLYEIKYRLFGNTGKNDYKFGHCSAFIATGDATEDGGIVMAHSLWFAPNYIPQRANLILDVAPIKGHRFIMTCFPGYIWSSEDYYQNDFGILLMETTLPAQGPWNTKGTIPTGVRARRAIQYSNTIDDVITSLVDGNNGLYANDWVMGDIKSGEIASLELALYNHAVTRTKNGFLYSANTAKDDKVRWELYSIFGLGIPGRIFMRKSWDLSGRSNKFEELKEEYYGKVNVDVAKKIMSTEPICRINSNVISTDCKITTTNLAEKFGLWVHMGNPDGRQWNPTSELKDELKGIQSIPVSGWLQLYGSRSEPVDLQGSNENDVPKKTCKVLWTTGEEKHDIKDFVPTAISKKIDWDLVDGEIVSEPIITDDEIFVGSSGGVYSFKVDTGNLDWFQGFSGSAHISKAHNNKIYVGAGNKYYAFDLISKNLLWEYETDGVITKASAASKNNVFFGAWDGNLYALDEKTGDLRWKYETGWGIDTTPAVGDGVVYVGSNDNNFYAIDEKTGGLVWYFTCKSGIHSSPVVYGEYVFFGSDDGRLYALDKTTGELVWNFAPEYTINDDDVNNYVTTPILNSPIVEDGIVYIEVKGTVYALDAQTLETPDETVIPKESNNVLLIMLILCLISFVLLSSVFIRNRKKTG